MLSAEGVSVCSVTEIPSVNDSEMQQHLQSLLLSACITDSVHDVVLQVHTDYIISLNLYNAGVVHNF